MNIRINGVLETRSASYVAGNDVINKLSSTISNLRVRIQAFLEGESMRDIDEEELSILFPKPFVACFRLIKEVI